MVRKTTWTLCSIIGISVFLIISSCAEKTIEKPQLNRYKYINNSEFDIKIESSQRLNDSIYKFKYNLLKNSALNQDLELASGSTSGLIYYADSVKISIVTDDKFHGYSKKDTSKFNVLLIENYQTTKNEASVKEFSYYFTNKDFD